jgi:hypothetical protein
LRAAADQAVEQARVKTLFYVYEGGNSFLHLDLSV